MEQKELFKVRDKRKRGWFWIDNEYLNGFGKILGAKGIAVYVSLCRHSDETETSFPSQKLIAKETGLSERSVRETIKELKRYNIIKILRAKSRDGRWLNNVYYLVDRSEWIYPEANNAPGSPEAKSDITRGKNEHSQRQQVPPNNTHRKNTNKNNTHLAKQSFAGSDINKIIDLFKPLNPNYEKLFANNTQRKCVAELLQKYGTEKLANGVRALPKIVSQPYSPTITTPCELRDKMGKLIQFVEKEKNKGRLKNIKYQIEEI